MRTRLLLRPRCRRARRADRRADRRAVRRARLWSSTTRRGPTNSSGWDRSSSPTIADVNGDGRNDIVIGHQDGSAARHQRATGRDLAGLAAADGHRDRQHAGRRRPLPQRSEARSSSASVRRWCTNQQGGVVGLQPERVAALRVPHASTTATSGPNNGAARRLRRRRVLVARDRRHQRRRLSRHRLRRVRPPRPRDRPQLPRDHERQHRGHRVVVARAVRHQR